MLPDVEFPGCVKTAADFTVGDDVFVQSDYGVRDGVVVKVGRTRVTVRHAAAGLYDVIERSYSMDKIVVGQYRRSDRDWPLVFATGNMMRWGETMPHGRAGPGFSRHIPFIDG